MPKGTSNVTTMINGLVHKKAEDIDGRGWRNEDGTTSYSEGQKLALHYKELSSNLAWRPQCYDCTKRQGEAVMMMKTNSGYHCLRCKKDVNNVMHTITKDSNDD